MKTLPRVTATAEQLPLISQNRLGVEVICGAAGSGKTSTALLRLRSLCLMFAARHARLGLQEPVRVLVLTFNRTLAGYVKTLAETQISAGANVRLEIDTFGRWAMSALAFPNVPTQRVRNKLRQLAGLITELSADYVVKEVDYLLGRFEPENLEAYIAAERTGRGAMPRVDRSVRRRLLDNVVYPYLAWLSKQEIADWNTVAVRMAREVQPIGYDVVIIDESQDFSANQLRAIRRHLGADHAVTFVIDTVQRIYARGFTWVEAGFDVRPERVHTLRANHRNTVEIAAFAASILNGITPEADGVLPNLAAATSRGPRPRVLRGLYNRQLEWVLNYIQANVDLTKDSVAFLKPQGGQWFDNVKAGLRRRGLRYVEITREADWPEGDENVALSTFHSAKGLEFDYVFLIGFNEENTPYPDEQVDDEVFVLRRLLAVAVARARREVIVGYKLGEQSRLTQYFGAGTYDEISV
ncbi:3'-5' exonuclease [Brevundimonas sp.]|uniref:3'-5' exonuclease n=1 Tax=Brevundimonas sp. TaxID=1871086 RepID=UPI001A35CEB0|nr:3'-5' exonuclease [Brevundimonas sp.]MBJ7484190.1 AAA family ATPase [Brevundimonas sp.]